MSHNTYVTLMVIAAFGLVLWSAWTLKQHSDDSHRKEAAALAFVSWLLMFGAIRHLEREHHENEEIAGVQNASEVFVVADKTDYSLSTPNGTQIEWSSSSGRRTPMSVIPRCSGIDDDTDRRTVGAFGRSDGPAVSVRNGTHGKSVMDAGKGF